MGKKKDKKLLNSSLMGQRDGSTKGTGRKWGFPSYQMWGNGPTATTSHRRPHSMFIYLARYLKKEGEGGGGDPLPAVPEEEAAAGGAAAAAAAAAAKEVRKKGG